MGASPALRALPAEWLHHLLLGGGGGVGGVLAYMLVRALAEKPEQMIAMLSQFGPWFLVVGGFLFIVDRRFGQIADSSIRSAASMQSLADAVRESTSHDSERAREQELVLGTMAREQSRTLELVQALHAKLESINAGQARAAGAGG